MSADPRVTGTVGPDNKDPQPNPKLPLKLVRDELQYDCHLRDGGQRSALIAGRRDCDPFAGVWYRARSLSFLHGWRPATTIVKVMAGHGQHVTVTFQIGRAVTDVECLVQYLDGVVTFERPVLHKDKAGYEALATTLNWVSTDLRDFPRYQVEFPRRNEPGSNLPSEMFAGDAPVVLNHPNGSVSRAHLLLEDRAPAFLGVVSRSVRHVETDIRWGQIPATDQPVVSNVKVRSSCSDDRLEVQFFTPGSVHIVRYERGGLHFTEIGASGQESFFAVHSIWCGNEKDHQPFRLRVAPLAKRWAWRW